MRAIATVTTGFTITIPLMTNPETMLQPRPLVLSLVFLIMSVAVDITAAIRQAQR